MPASYVKVSQTGTDQQTSDSMHAQGHMEHVKRDAGMIRSNGAIRDHIPCNIVRISPIGQQLMS
jgi:hypothetical protein